VPKAAKRATNQAAMSEELPAVNEEVETSKEQLQSLNEELTALNSQLQEALEQNQSVVNDLENILNSTDVATLFLDGQFNIRFFTPAVTPLLGIIASDIGRPLADLVGHFAEGKLLADARAVLSSLTLITREVAAENGAWYICRILPYRTKDNRIEGVVITFVDVTERKRAEDAVNAAKLAAESVNLGKSRSLAAASRDLRQHLQAFTLLLDLLEMEVVEDSPASQLIVRGREALTAMTGVLNTPLDISQLEALDLLACIAHAIEQHLSDLSQRSTGRYAATARFAALTPRQRQVMDLVLAGQPSKNIAADLGVSQRTIESHRASLMRRVGAKTLPELVRLAVEAT
jgi:two-component system CheB/CheR fusion protein